MAAKFDYARMAATADTLITRFSQGLVTVERVTAEGERPPELPIWQPWEPEVTVRQYRLSATVRTVERKFVDGALILVTDEQVTCSDKMTLISVDGDPVDEEEVAFDATLLDTLKIDGRPHIVLKQAPTPGAGTKIVHKLIVRGGMMASVPSGPRHVYVNASASAGGEVGLPIRLIAVDGEVIAEARAGIVSRGVIVSAPVTTIGEVGLPEVDQTSFWTPADLGSDLAHWYDASDSDTIDASGGIVAGWSDKSGNGHHLLQSEPSRRGTLTAENANFNNLPTIAFPNPGGMTSATKADFHNTAWLTDGTHSGMRYGTTGARGPLGWSLPANAILAARFPEGTLTAGNVSFRRNGTTYSPNGTEGTVNSAGAGTAFMVGRVKSYGQDISFGRIIDAGGTFTLGGRESDWTRIADIDFAEVITIAGELALEDIERVEGYLAHKWGLAGALPGEHPYKDSPPEN